jgi:hypothetical protein
MKCLYQKAALRDCTHSISISMIKEAFEDKRIERIVIIYNVGKS